MKVFLTLIFTLLANANMTLTACHYELDKNTRLSGKEAYLFCTENQSAKSAVDCLINLETMAQTSVQKNLNFCKTNHEDPKSHECVVSVYNIGVEEPDLILGFCERVKFNYEAINCLIENNDSQTLVDDKDLEVCEKLNN